MRGESMISIKKMEQEAQQLVALSITLSELKNEEGTVSKEIMDLEHRNKHSMLDADIYHRLWKAAKAKQDSLGRRILVTRSRMERAMSSLDAGLTALASSVQKRV